MRLAIIDLGTNTFNLLIVDVHPNKTYDTVFQTKISVKLGEGGINQNYITPEAFVRGLTALSQHKQTIDTYKTEKVYSFATSAIRSASNGAEFVARVKNEIGFDISVISGDREAELIYYGVREAVQMNNETSLVIDIGGGSTEFIICNHDKIYWKQSFLLGAARLLERINPSDPIKEKEAIALRDYLETELKPLFEAVAKYPITELIGSSGSFDSLAEMIACKYYSPEILDDTTEYLFNLEDCAAIYEELLVSTRDQRLKMPGLVEMRVDMIVISSILVHFIITKLEIGRMRLSSYSLKEGVLYELLK